MSDQRAHEPPAALSSTQELAAIDETRAAVRLVDEGLSALGRIDGANDFYHLPLQLLAQGFERLLKLILVLGELEQHQALVTISSIKGHDLVSLTDRVVALMDEVGSFTDRPAVASDIEFIRTDAHLRAMVAMLGRFGVRARYHNINLLLGDPWDEDEDPSHLFNKIEGAILREHPDWMARIGTAEFEGFYEVVIGDLTERLQRYARSLCRAYTLGVLGQRGQAIVGEVKRFLYLQDHQLRTLPSQR